MPIPVVILSFTEALDQMARGELSDEELSSAIFCLGCRREWLNEYDVDFIMNRQRNRHQREEVPDEAFHRFLARLKRAQKKTPERVIWPRNIRDAQEGQDAISRALESIGLRPLNPNLPPSLDNRFLQSAIERANNTDGVVRVRTVYYTN